MSQPTLWAPSSYMLKSDASALTPKAFLDYLQRGEIRIFGRYEWLCEPGSRKESQWEGSAWDRNIDAEIKRICEEDENKIKSARRVVIVPAENGYKFADDYLDQHPDEITRWERIIKSKRRYAIPSGSREAALQKMDDGPREAARRILRDAYNHGQAIAYSEADAPLLVQRMHRDFLRILADAPPFEDTRSSHDNISRLLANSGQRIDWNSGIIADELLAILAEFDIASRSRTDVDSLDSFIGGQGRKDLMRWLSQICVALREIQPKALNKQLDGLLTKQLRQEINDGNFPTFWAQLKERKSDGALAAASLVLDALVFAIDPLGAIGLAPLALSVFAVGKLVRQMGYAPDGFTGPHWPFLYTYGQRPTPEQVDQLRYVLNVLYNRKSGDLPS